LDEPDTHFVAKEPIHVEGMALVGGMHRAQHIDVYTSILDVLVPGHHPIEGTLAPGIDPVGVVKLSRAVDG
jgi:hypothetical protein